jgi:hypothetical protein
MTDDDSSVSHNLRQRRRRRAWRRAAGAAAAIVLLVIVAYAAADHGVGGAQQAPFETGVRGTVMKEPLAAVGQRPKPAGSPILALIQIRDTRGNAKGAMTSDADGEFGAELPPGTYILIAVSPIDTAMPVSRPVRVVVREGEITWAHLTLPSFGGPDLAASLPPSP